MKPEIILASNSPRRRELLSMLGMRFRTLVSECDENIEEKLPPEELVMTLAMRKASAVASMPDISQSCIIIGADTIVWDRGTPLGKPADAEDAQKTLLSLSDGTHSVYTGLALIGCIGGRIKRVSDAVETKVVFGHITPEDAAHYVSLGEPMDKAGSYGIQGVGGVFVKELHGDYFNVVGLPIARLRELLASEFGYNILSQNTEDI